MAGDLGPDFKPVKAMICQHLPPPLRGGADGNESGHGFCRMPGGPGGGPGGMLHPVGGAGASCGSARRGDGVFLRLQSGLRILPEPHHFRREITEKLITVERLREIFQELDRPGGAACLELVTPTHFRAAYPAGAWETAAGRCRWCITAAATRAWRPCALLEGKVQVYLPDLKYALTATLAAKLLAARRTTSPVATAAIEEMYRQTGPCVIEDGILKRGVLIRHLVLPGAAGEHPAVSGLDRGAIFPPGRCWCPS